MTAGMAPSPADTESAKHKQAKHISISYQTPETTELPFYALKRQSANMAQEPSKFTSGNSQQHQHAVPVCMSPAIAATTAVAAIGPLPNRSQAYKGSSGFGRLLAKGRRDPPGYHAQHICWLIRCWPTELTGWHRWECLLQHINAQCLLQLLH